MKRYFIFLLFSVNLLQAQNYSVSLIPDSLLENAHSVKRMEDFHVIIKSLNKVIIKHKYAITILDEQGDDNAEYVNAYSSMHDLSNIDGNLYDAKGKKLKSVKRKDIEDVPQNDGFSLMLDGRIKKHNFYCRQYPYTVEYEDEEESKETYFLPSWTPVEGAQYSVQQSKYSVEVPTGYQLRIKQQNFSSGPAMFITQATAYSWELKNFKAIVEEPFQYNLSSRVPIIYIGPSDFAFSGYTGDMRSWQSLGNFNVALNKGRDVLPEKVQQDIHQLVEGISDVTERVKKVYQYMQNNTRYISVQLGIGGWQPFDAKYVTANKYGDCKALSNYMVSLLKEIGIKANYVLVAGGRDRMGLGLNDDFPIPSYFNHVICCVPGNKDSLWLECTSQTSPAGFMGSFTGNRKALLIDEDGGHVVNTPTYKAKDNQQIRLINAEIDADGNMVAEVNTHFTGIQQELQHSLIHDATKEEREKYLNRALGISTYEVDKSVYTEKPGILPEVNEYLHLKATGYATVSGKRLFIVPNLFNRSATKLSEDKERKFPIQFKEAYLDIDTVIFHLPPGYQLEARPKDVHLENPFGQYHVTYLIDDKSIKMIRTKVQERNTFPATEYPALVAYYDTIYKSDHNRIVLVKKEG